MAWYERATDWMMRQFAYASMRQQNYKSLKIENNILQIVRVPYIDILACDKTEIMTNVAQKNEVRQNGL